MSLQPAVQWRRLGAILVSREVITADQLRQAFEEQAVTGRRLGSGHCRLDGHKRGNRRRLR